MGTVGTAVREPIQALARQLHGLGTRHVFGITGSGPSLELITALEALGVMYYPVSHEAAGAIMAGAVTRILDRPAVSLSIKGPGLANMTAGIIANALEGYPALSIAESYDDETPGWRRHKRIDQVALLRPVTQRILHIDEVGDGLELASRQAFAEPRGPWHLELSQGPTVPATTPEAVPGTETGPARSTVAGSGSGSCSLEQLAAALRESSRPLVIAGSLACRRRWGARLAELEVPVLTTVAARGLLDERAEHAAGIFTGAGRELAPEVALLAAADLVLGVGLRNQELLGFPFPRHTFLVDEITTGSGGFPNGDHLTVASEAETGEILAGLAGRGWGVDLVADTKRRLRDHLLDGSWLPAACFEALNQLRRDHDLICDTGSFCTVGEHLFQARPERVFYCSGNGRNMGTAIPTAIGIAVAKPRKPLFCMVGDGGFGMYAAELKLAVAEGLPICFVLSSDGAYGSIACAPQSHPMSTRATTIRQPSWLEAVRGLGCPARSAADAADFTDQITAWNDQEPLFIECRFATEPYARMTEKLR